VWILIHLIDKLTEVCGDKEEQKHTTDCEVSSVSAMKKHLIGLVVVIFSHTASSTTYAASSTIKYFQNYEGKWKSESKKGGNYFLTVTNARTNMWAGTFTISQTKSDGVDDSVWMLIIVEQAKEELHAIYFFGSGTRYFRGRVDHDSTKVEFESLFPELKQPNHLIVDFSESPEFAPEVTVSHKNPGANTAE